MVTCSKSMGECDVLAGEVPVESTVDGAWLILRDGYGVAVGPLVTGDESAIASWFAGLGAETRYARFLAPQKRLDRHLQSALARVDHVDHEAIAARAWDGATVGIARYMRLGRSMTAEVAVAVADGWRGRGIATILLERLAGRARAVGIEHLTATCLATNDEVIRLFRRIGETTVGPSIAGIVDVTIDLTRRSPRRADPDADPVSRSPDRSVGLH